MTISKWMTAGTVLKMMAMQYPDKPGAADKMQEDDLQGVERTELPVGQCADEAGGEKGRSLCHPGLQLRRMDGDLCGLGKRRDR